MTGSRALVAPYEHELIAMRRHLHAQPELSGEEHLTTEFLVDRLAVEGLDPVVLSRGTGVVCDIPLDPAKGSVPDEPIVVLRADIDGLAMDDLTGASYRSRVPGVAHACGHDVHTSAVMGAALALLDVRRAAPLGGTVRLVFEPAEETVPGGAVDVIAEGWMDGVRAVFGVHCDPRLDVGTVGLRTGPLTSAADQFEIALSGPGGHTARPRETVDLVRWTARVADRLWDEVQARLASPVVVAFGAVHAGDAMNVIPSSSVLRGSFRTADRGTWAMGGEAMRASLTSLLASAGLGPAPAAELTYRVGLPPVVNDVDSTALARVVVERELGPQAGVEAPQSWGGDSFAWYTERVPGSYLRLGTHDPAGPDGRLDLHSATFDVDERAIAIGASILAGCALAAVS